MTSPKPSAGRYPKKTFGGRKRVSLWPRWVSNWIITGAIIYFMGSYALRFAGVDTAGWDPFAQSAFASVPTSTPLPDYPINDQDGFYASSNPNDNLFADTPTPTVVYQAVPTYTVMPTYTPYPTQQPYFGKLIAIGYSYYWPPFGPPNCGPENWHPEINFCDDMTASGLQWSLYVGHGVAVPVQWRNDIPLGSTIRVHSPASMVGDYLVLDYCGACIKPEGHIYFDFLDNRARLNWTVPMLVEVIKNE